jgi:hypothetical protein
LGSEISVETLGEEDYEAWTRLVAASPEGSIYSLPRYLEILCRAAGGRFHVLGVRQGEELAGGVALYEQDSALGPYVLPRPLLYYNGVVLQRYGTKYPSEQTARHLKVMGGLASALLRRGYRRISLRCRASVVDVRPFLAAGWTASLGYTYLVPIGDIEATKSRVEQNLRRLVRRCEREGMTLTDDDDFESFFRLHAGNAERKSLGLYLPGPAFRGYFEALRAAGLCRLYHARLPSGRAVSTQLVLLGPGAVAHAASAAGDPELQRTGAAAFLRLKVFEALSAMGYAGNDLTDATLNPVAHFKSQLGGDLQLLPVLEAPRALRFRIASRVGAALRGARAPLGRWMGRGGPARP